MDGFPRTRLRNLWLALIPVLVLAGGLLFVSDASADVTGTVLTGSSGNVTLSLNSVFFNNDSAAIGGGNSDVANGDTFMGLGVFGKASDTGVGGLATGSDYQGGFSDFFSSLLPNGTAPTPQNIQLYFCPGVVCTAADFTSGKSITSSQSGSFTADDSSHIPPVPEPSSLLLSALGSITLLLVGTGLLKFSGC